MCFFKKKNKQPKTKDLLENKNVISNNANLATAFMSYAGLDEETIKKLEDLAEKLKYLNPSDKKEVHAIDKKIENKLMDIKIEVSKGKVNQTAFDKTLIEITNLVADRNMEAAKR